MMRPASGIGVSGDTEMMALVMTSPTVTSCGSLPLATTLVRTSLSVIMPRIPSSD